jgi:hypothetical protein
MPYFVLVAACLKALLLTACGAFAIGDSNSTLEAEQQGYVAEATAIQSTLHAHSAQVAGTARAAETQVAVRQDVNAALYATVQAGSPPTQQIISSAGGANTPQAILQGERWFVKTGLSPSVRDSDGCAERAQSDFTPDASRIYATFKAFNIGAGTPLSARWSYEGQTRIEESFVLDRSAGEICLWFYIEPSMVEFTPGLWDVRLYAEGFQLEAPMTFRIVG